jgi:hypothetical protein
MTHGIDDATLAGALAPIASALAADGYELSATREGSMLNVSVAAGPEACQECLVPKDLMAQMIRTALSNAGLAAASVNLTYPAQD